MVVISQNKKFHQEEIVLQTTLNSLTVQGFTKRLYIRSYLDEDFKQCIFLYGGKETTKYFDHGEPRSEEEIKEYVKDRGPRYFSKGEPFGIFSVFLREEGTFLGQVDLVPTDVPGEVEIGWIFDPKHQNSGYCSEAVLAFLMPFIRLIREKGFTANGKRIERVIATAHPENIPSNRIIQKAGLIVYQFKLRYGGKPRNWYALNLNSNI